MSKPRNSCVESHATTSPENCCARKIPSEDLPEAVGPRMTTSRGSDVIETAYAKPARQKLRQSQRARCCRRLVVAQASFVNLEHQPRPLLLVRGFEREI